MGALLEKLKPMSPGQEEMLQALTSDEYEIVGLFGPTGSGKSLFSVLYGIDAVLEGKYKRLIISRPVVDVVTGRELTAQELGEQYYEIASAYLRDILAGFIEWQEVEKLIDEGKIMFADTHYLRGRTFDDSIIFLDDSQNIPPESSVEILMRIGRNSKFVIAGDPVFQKPHGVERDGATVMREVLVGEENAKVVDLGLKDIVRPGARRGIRLLIEMRMRNRPLNEAEKRVMEAARIYAPDADVITVVEFIDAKKQFQITAEHVPDALILVKEGYLGRLVGRGGERIQKIEQDTELRLRAVELTLDFTNIIRAVHPVSWIYKHVVDVDFEGPYLAVRVRSDEFGAFVGQRGFHVKFLDAVFRKLLGVGVKAYEVEEETRRRRRR
ncbi:phosphate starvation-inducible protein PhoH [Pyrodictium occultum]|uniref:Phosphate starvation-inducible protein PhoH n=1 Tax=Pyrodictium occultum TaxID=2309 RepID=A0A0V8RXN9_PYROC|nr:PhoH family protein [Pyrodictium occultum]KSW12730.1 phosphate starvation-inducible protein PhoH [Pyrodictium occultum]